MSHEQQRAAPRGWVKLYKFLPSNPKVIGLNDSAFRAYLTALALSDDEQVRGRWMTRDYLAAAIGKRLARHIPTLLERELLVEYEDGMIGIHNFEYWNPVDEGNRIRQARWYENNRREAAGLPRQYADGRQAVRPNVPNALLTDRPDIPDSSDPTRSDAPRRLPDWKDIVPKR